MKPLIILAASLGSAASVPVATSQTLPTGSSLTDGIPEFTALLEVGIAHPAGDTAHATFPDNGSGSYAFSFDNKWLPGVGRVVDPAWGGTVGATVTGSTVDGTQRAFGQVSGYEVNGFWPTGLTGPNDFAPAGTPSNSGLFYDSIGRGTLSATNGLSAGVGTWTVDFQFSGLANGYLPAGTLLSFIDIGDDPDGVDAESLIFTAGLPGGGVQPWMIEIDHSVGLGVRDQPAPVWRGGNVYDVGFESPKLATGGAEYVVMQTTVALESLLIDVSQGPGSGTLGFEILAPLAMPEPSIPALLAGALAVCGRRRR